jgi:hypothetical protein
MIGGSGSMADLYQIAGRPAEYLSETGTPQLLGGLVLFILGVSALIQTLMVTRGASNWFLVVQFAGLCCVGIVFWRLSALKRRIVFPRGGYVRPRGRMWIYFRAALVGLAGLAYSVFSDMWPRLRIGIESPLLWPAFMIVFAIIGLDSGWRQKNALTLWFSVYIACLAPLVWLLPLNNYARSGALMMALGAPIAVRGALRLRLFVLSNPMPPEPRNE